MSVVLDSNLLQRAREGDRSAQCLLGITYYNATHLKNNLELALYWLQLSAEQEYAGAQWRLADLNVQKGQTAVELYIKAALQDDMTALKRIHLWKNDKSLLEKIDQTDILVLAFCYHHGLFGFKKDKMHAMNLYEKSSSSNARYQLGILYQQSGQYKKAGLSYKLASTDRYKSVAVNRLAFLYENGLIGTVDTFEDTLERAIRLYTSIATMDDPCDDAVLDAKISLAKIYRKMNDNTNAIKWYIKTLETNQAEKRQYRIAKSCLDQIHPSQYLTCNKTATLSSRLRLDISQISDLDIQTRLKATALRAFKKDGNAMYDIANFYGQGDHFSQDDHISFLWMKNAAIIGKCKEAQFSYGKLMRQQGDTKSFIEWYSRAANQGHTESQYLLGIYYSTSSSPVNVTEAYKWFSMAAAQNYHDACYQLGLLGLNNQDELPFDHEFANFFKRSADQGYIPAIYHLGKCYFDGTGGVQRDRDIGITYYEYCASKNFTDAFFTLGVLYENGTYLGKNDTRTFDYFSLAAEQGHTEAKYKLAIMYLKQVVVKLDYEKAYTLFKDAADSNHAKAKSIFNTPMICSIDLTLSRKIYEMFIHISRHGIAKLEYNLGYICEHACYDDNGQLVLSRNIPDAVYWYSIAANKHDDVRAQIRLGVLYEKGAFNLERNLEASISYYIKAIDQGNREAMYNMACIYLGRRSPISNRKPFIIKNISDANTPKLFGFDPMLTLPSTSDKCPSTTPSFSFGGGSSIDTSTIKDGVGKCSNTNSNAQSTSTISHETQTNSDLLNTSPDIQNTDHSSENSHEGALATEVQNLKEAFYLLREAANMGHKKARDDLDLSSNRLLCNDKSKMKMFEIIANEGNVGVQYQLGCFYTDLESSKAIKWLELAAKNNITDAYYKLALIYEKEVIKNGPKIVHLFQKSADNADALYKLAEMYCFGKHISKDYSEAFGFYQKASQQNHIKALSIVDGNSNDKNHISMYEHIAEKYNNVKLQYALGSIYENSDSGPDHSTAIKWYNKAAKENHEPSLYRLGKLFESGIGVEKDLKRAVDYYMEAEKQGSSRALYSLGEMYQFGRGVQVNEQISLNYYNFAADKNNHYAQFKLGELYEHGIMVERNVIRAAQYYRNVYSQGFDEAALRLYNLYDILAYEANFGNKLSALLSKIEKYDLAKNEGAPDSTVGRLHFRKAILFYNGNGVERDFVQSINSFIISSEKYHYPQATLFLDLGYTKDSNANKVIYKKKLKMLESTVDHLDNERIYNLAMVYFHGIFIESTQENNDNQVTEVVKTICIIPQNYYKALLLFEKAAYKEDYRSFTRIAEIYQDELWLSKDMTKAANYHRSSANLRTNHSNYKVGLQYYQNGNHFASMIYMNKACEQKNYLATRYVGEMFRHGQGVPKNFSKAMSYFKRLSDQSAEFDFKVGMEYYEGNTVEKEFYIAMVYFEKAAKKGHKEALKYFCSLYDQGCSLDLDISVRQDYLNENLAKGNDNAEPILNRFMEKLKRDKKDDEHTIEWHKEVSNKQNGEKNNADGEKYYNDKFTKHDYSTALIYFTKAAEQEHRLAQTHLADMYYYGQGVAKNDKLAREWYLKSADNGFSFSNYLQGRDYYIGKETRQNFFAANIYFEKAGKQGNSPALEYLGEIYRNGHGVDVNLEISFRYYKESSEKLNGDNNYDTGLKYYEGRDVEKNYSVALIYIKKSVEQKNSSGCSLLAKMYFFGHGVEEHHHTSSYYVKKAEEYRTATEFGKQKVIETAKDWFDYEINSTRSIEWHEKFSSNQEAHENYKIGLNYFENTYYQDHINLAVFYIKKAADRNYPEAQIYLADMHRSGKLIEKDDDMADILYKKAAEGKHSCENYEIGFKYFNGEHTTIDYLTALIFFTKSSEFGCGVSCRYIADMYNSGKGVEKNLEEAIKYYKKSASHQNVNGNYECGIQYYNCNGLDNNYIIAFIYIEKATEQGCISAQVLLGDFYYRGLGVDQDYLTAFFHLQKAASNGDEQGKTKIITYDFHNQNMNRNKVIESNVKFANLQDRDDNYTIGLKFYDGTQYTQDLELATIYLKKAAEEEHIEALRYLGDIHYPEYDTEKNQGLSFHYYVRAADKQYGYYNHILGRDYYANGNYLAAFVFMKKSAEQGNILAFKYLGDFYHYGYGVEKDEVKSVEYHRKNASSLDSLSNYKLGMEYYYGTDADKCYTISSVYFQSAVDQGHNESQLYLIDMYMNGFGVEKDTSVASAYLRKIIHQNSGNFPESTRLSTDSTEFHTDIASKQNLFENYMTGSKYYHGDSIKQNYDFAIIYLTRARMQGLSGAQKLLDDLYEKGY